MEPFCQPLGWMLSSEHHEPKFFVTALTDIDGNRHYCACLSFYEEVSIPPSKIDEEDDSALDIESYQSLGLNQSLSSIHHTIMYAPTCLVLVSRHDYAETFRNWCVSTASLFSLLTQSIIINSVILVYAQPRDNLHSTHWKYGPSTRNADRQFAWLRVRTACGRTANPL